MILEENNLIKIDRKKLFVILNKNNNSKREIKWLNNKFKQYGVEKRFVDSKIRMDEIPVSLAIAQAAKETGWEHPDLLLKEMHYLDNGAWSDDE